MKSARLLLALVAGDWLSGAAGRKARITSLRPAAPGRQGCSSHCRFNNQGLSGLWPPGKYLRAQGLGHKHAQPAVFHPYHALRLQ